MKNVCIITTTRAEYGQLRWIIDDIQNDPNFNLQLIVSGAHLSSEQGLTYREIEKDGYAITDKIEICLSSVSSVGIAKSMGLLLLGICDTFARLKPDIIVVLGDRYELLSIVNAALVMNIPIAHIGGGDLTEGAIDNEIRNAVTMMSSLHFASTEACACRIERMIGCNQNIFVTGDRSLDNYKRLTLMNRIELASSLGIDAAKRWVLMTYHPETKVSTSQNLAYLKILTHFLDEKCNDYEIIITKANTDLGGIEINQYLDVYASLHKNVHLFSSLGQLRFNSICFQLEFMIGNSSSGIYESSYCKLPTINVGHRQDGRYLTENIISVNITQEELCKAFAMVADIDFRKKLQNMSSPYGDGNASKKIVEQIKVFLDTNE